MLSTLIFHHSFHIEMCKEIVIHLNRMWNSINFNCL